MALFTFKIDAVVLDEKGKVLPGWEYHGTHPDQDEGDIGVIAEGLTKLGETMRKRHLDKHNGKK